MIRRILSVLDPQTVTGLCGILCLGLGGGGLVDHWAPGAGVWAGLVVIGACLYAVAMRGGGTPPMAEE